MAPGKSYPGAQVSSGSAEGPVRGGPARSSVQQRWLPGMRKKRMRGEGRGRREPRVIYVASSTHSPGVNVTCPRVRELQWRYPALSGPGNNDKDCGYLGTPSAIFSRVVVARNVPPSSPPKCVDRVMRDSTHSPERVAPVAQTLGPKRRGQGWGRFTSTEICFLLGMTEDERTEAGASLTGLPLVVTVSGKEPLWEEAQAVALGPGLCPSASRLRMGACGRAAGPRGPSPTRMVGMHACFL